MGLLCELILEFTHVPAFRCVCLSRNEQRTMENRCVKWLTVAQQPTTFLGMETAAWTVDIVAIVGPKEMDDLGDKLIARLKLDWIYYSPTGWSQGIKEKDRILRYAEVADKDKFFTALSSSYVQGRVDLDRYKAAHHEFQLDHLWNALAEGARRILGNPKPKQRT